MYSNLEIITLPFVQHTRAAYWFYRFLSMVYDTYIDLLFWTERMRTQALTLARLNDPNLQVIDVGSGTGLTTQRIVKSVNARQVICVDQSPHQQKKAKAKPELNGCALALGDAEQIPMRSIGSTGMSRPTASNIGQTLRRVFGMCYLVAVPETLLP